METTFFDKLNTKKILFIMLSIMFGMWMIHEIIFWSYLHEAEKALKQVNAQFAAEQEEIHKTIDDSNNEFQKRQAAFNQQSEQFEKAVNDAQQSIFNYLSQTENEAAAREKAFDQSFKSAPDKMWAEHEKFAKHMEDDYRKETVVINKNITNDFNQSTEKARCQSILSKVNLPLPSNLPLAELTQQNQMIKQLRISIARQEHCERYL